MILSYPNAKAICMYRQYQQAGGFSSVPLGGEKMQLFLMPFLIPFNDTHPPTPHPPRKPRSVVQKRQLYAVSARNDVAWAIISHVKANGSLLHRRDVCLSIDSLAVCWQGH